MSYEFEAGTVLLAQQCIICGRPLRTPASIERGMGDECADKHQFGGAPGRLDEKALVKALEEAPAPLRAAFEKGFDRGGIEGAISMAIHTTGNMWESTTPDNARPYLRSFIQLASASGYYTMGAAIEKRLEKYLSPPVENVNKFDLVRLKTGETGEVFWAGTRFGKPAFGLKTSPSAEPTWFKLGDVAEVKEKIETVSVSDFKPSDVKPPCKVELQDGSIREVVKTGTSSRGFWLGLKRLDGSRGYDFTNLDNVVEIIYADKPEAPKTGIQPEDIVVPCRVELRDGSVRKVLKTGVNSRGFWIGVEKPKGGGSKFDFVDLEEVVAVLPPLTPQTRVKRAAPVRSLKLDPKLFPHQAVGAEWLAARPGAILADDMGLGKTATAIFAMSVPAVVICPASLRTNWAREIGFWRPELSVSVVEGKNVDYSADVVVCNFERAKGPVLEALEARGSLTVVVDEAHALKNLRVSMKNGEHKLSGSQRAQNVWDLCNFGGPGKTRVDHVYLLTGTPMPNGRHEELFPLLNLADGGDTEEFANFYKFCASFCPPEDIPGPTNAKDYSNNEGVEELKQLIAPLLLRRTKDLLDLPPKFRQEKLVDMDEASRKEYTRAAKEFRAWIQSVGGADALNAALRAEAIVKMTKLRELAAIGKIPGVTEEITSYLQGSERPLVVMAHHRKVIDSLDKSLVAEGFRVGRIDGSTKDRQQVVDDFQGGKLDVVLCSISAAGVGLTLTAADTLYFVERVWRPFDLRQAEDRIHRIGQKNTATIVYFDAPNTIDEMLSEVIDTKIAAADAVLGSSEPGSSKDPLVADGASEESVAQSVLKKI